MLDERKKQDDLPFKQRIMRMKGQAVPLFGYHILREHVLKELTGEFQSSILYWMGKNLAQSFEIQSFEECRDVFLELGWGYLEKEQSTAHIHRYRLDSPFFPIRKVEENDSTFSLECGFLTEVIGTLADKDTEGEFNSQLQTEDRSVQFIIYLQDKE